MHGTYESGIHKAAVLIASLDGPVADRLLERLPAACAERVRRAAMDMGPVDADLCRRVIEEIRRLGPLIPDRLAAGIDLAVPPADVRRVQRKRSGAAVPGESAQDDPLLGQEASTPFGFLHRAEAEKLLGLLVGERPQTVALVLAHLPPEQAGETLARFAPEMQVEVVRRLVDLGRAAPETLREIEQTLQSRLSRQFDAEAPSATGPDAVGRILDACPGNVVADILDHLAEYDLSLARRLGRRTIEFDELGRFDDATLSAVVRAAEPEVLEAALVGSPPLLVERICCLMSPKDAKPLREKLDCPGPIRLSDVEDARRRIAALAGRIQYGKRSKAALAA